VYEFDDGLGNGAFNLAVGAACIVGDSHDNAATNGAAGWRD
jgi:hypothetical protein